MHWGPNFFSQNGAQPLVYVVVLLMSQHFRKAAEYMGDQAELREHGTHMAIACNHLKVSISENEHFHPPPGPMGLWAGERRGGGYIVRWRFPAC